MQLESFRELKIWYDIITREIIEDNIIKERVIKNKPPLTSQTLKRMVDKKLREYKEVV